MRRASPTEDTLTGLAFTRARSSMKFTKKVWESSSAPVTAPKKAPRYYPAEDIKKKLGNHHNTTKQTKLRASITPGTVLILLAGHFKGSRVVFLKQLESGLLLISGPYEVNGVPLRRVPQSYVIATKTVVDVSGVKVPAEVNDDLFKKPKTANKKDDEQFFGSKKDKESTIDESRKALQKKVDSAILSQVNKTPLLKEYLGSKFSLKNGDKPHNMNF